MADNAVPVTDKSAAAPEGDYYDRIHRKVWSRRTAGFLTGATIFAAFGAIGGLVASVLPYALGAAAAPTLGAVAITVATFTAASAFVGITIAADVGANAAAAAATLEEMDRREGRESPKAVAPAPDAPKPKMYNWKVGATTSALFAAFGLLTAFHPTAATFIVKGLGVEAGSSGAIVGSTALMGMLGSTMGINAPILSNNISNFFSKLLKGKFFEKAPEPALAASPQPQVEIENPLPPVMAEPQRDNGKVFAAERGRFSLQGIIEKSDEHSVSREIIISR